MGSGNDLWLYDLWRRLQPRRWLRPAAVAAATTLLVAALWWWGALSRLEGIAFDAVANQVRADVAAPSEVAVILVDEASLQAMDPVVGRWPWPRSVFADVVEFLALGGARAVVLDILFLERERAAHSPPEDSPPGDSLAGAHSSGDQRLIDASREAGCVTHAARILREEEDDPPSPLLHRALPADFVQRQQVSLGTGSGAPAVGPANNNYYLPMNGLHQAAARVGVVDFAPDDDGVFRRVQLFHTYQGRHYPSLGLAPLLDVPTFSPVGWEPGGVRLGRLPVPLDRRGRYLVNPYGSYQTYSMSGVLASIQRLWQGEVEDLLVSPYEFEGRVVYVGASATGLEDLKRTALLHSAPGVYLHAGVAANLLSGDVLRPVPVAVSVLLIAVVALSTVALILGARRTVVQAGAPLLLAGGYLAGAVTLFAHNRLVPLVPPLLAIVVGWLVAFALRAATEGRYRRRVRNMLAQYVSPAVLNEVVDRYQDVLRAEVGQSCTLSVLFSDIRGFTELSEQLDAREVVELLNVYFSHMTDAVFENEGTVDKFIGDAMMCFWGAPILCEQHAERAVRCALAMEARLATVNRVLATRGRAPIRIGVGVNTGSMVLGNIGSARKLDYTVIGDEVNLASRLEGLTKYYGCSILLSETTRRCLGDDLPCAVVDRVRVKGKSRAIGVYRPLVAFHAGGAEVEAGRQLQGRYEQAFAAYQERDWERALRLYQELPDDGVRQQFVQRCRDLLRHGAPQNWDGVHVLTSK